MYSMLINIADYDLWMNQNNSKTTALDIISWSKIEQN